jgi:hypothetical protein
MDRTEPDRADYDNLVAALRRAVDEVVFAAAWTQGQAMTLEQAIRVALEESEIPTAGGKDS